MNNLLRIAKSPCRVSKVILIQSHTQNITQLSKLDRNIVKDYAHSAGITPDKALRIIRDKTFGITMLSPNSYQAEVVFSLPTSEDDLADTLIHECYHILLHDFIKYKGRSINVKHKKEEELVQQLTRLALYLMNRKIN